MSSTSTRRLRENLRATLARAAKGQPVTVLRRGEPYVRIVAAGEEDQPLARYPLRGSVVMMADDFDAPLPDLWSALNE